MFDFAYHYDEERSDPSLPDRSAKATEKCAICGDYFREEDIAGWSDRSGKQICRWCYLDALHDPMGLVNACKDDDKTDKVEINYALSLMFEPGEIEAILIRHIKENIVNPYKPDKSDALAKFIDLGADQQYLAEAIIDYEEKKNG